MKKLGMNVAIVQPTPLQIDTRPPLSTHPTAQQVATQPLAVNITIHAASGQDERTIARMVAQEMQRIQNQQQARLRSRLRDRE
ncbi:hypothetical protein [Necropsobacter massiliensis]|uniref:hypothetical protein n=1 Tax=Necropsobacter massiliensis TaxID=1400001 RepID=UPI000595D915|nr:hypothetical protein [Necropsobacter massiliensis]